MREKYRSYLRARNFSPKTIYRYINILDHYFAFLSLREEISYRDATFIEIDRYKRWLLKELHYRPSSVYTYLNSVKVFYKFLIRSDRIKSNPFDLVDPVKVPKRLPRDILTEKEMSVLLAVPDVNTHMGVLKRTILETFYASAIRLSELCSLCIYDVNTQRQELRVKGKGSKDRVQPLTNVACMWLRLYIETVRPNIVADRSDSALFVGGQGGRPINPNIIQRFIRKCAKQAGIKKKVTPHTIRATTATHLLKRGASLREVQELLSHSLITTTELYTRIYPQDLIKEIKKHHPKSKK